MTVEQIIRLSDPFPLPYHPSTHPFRLPHPPNSENHQHQNIESKTLKIYQVKIINIFLEFSYLTICICPAVPYPYISAHTTSTVHRDTTKTCTVRVQVPPHTNCPLRYAKASGKKKTTSSNAGLMAGNGWALKEFFLFSSSSLAFLCFLLLIIRLACLLPHSHFPHSPLPAYMMTYIHRLCDNKCGSQRVDNNNIISLFLICCGYIGYQDGSWGSTRAMPARTWGHCTFFSFFSFFSFAKSWGSPVKYRKIHGKNVS